jgi:hypothetical protein
LARRTRFRLEATAAIVDGKALGSFERRSLALWWANDKAAAAVSGAVQGALDACHRIGTALESAAKEAAGISESPSVLPRQLYESLFVALDAELSDALQEMFAEFAAAQTEDAAREFVNARRTHIVRKAASEALALFDSSFSFATIDIRAIHIATARANLAAKVRARISAETPRKAQRRAAA